MFIVFEGDVCKHELAVSLDEDPSIGVDQNVGNRRISQQRLERSEAEELMLDIIHQSLSFSGRKRHCFLGQHTFGESRDFRMNLLRRKRRKLRQVHPVYQGAMKPGFYLLKTMLAVALGIVDVREAERSSFFD